MAEIKLETIIRNVICADCKEDLEVTVEEYLNQYHFTVELCKGCIEIAEKATEDEQYERGWEDCLMNEREEKDENS